uniref:Uncharacterized protein n=1 Tax=Glossina brevipalpis TaxID=37001 RepID=A0A1A9X597_9MUSC
MVSKCKSSIQRYEEFQGFKHPPDVFKLHFDVFRISFGYEIKVIVAVDEYTYAIKQPTNQPNQPSQIRPRQHSQITLVDTYSQPAIIHVIVSVGSGQISFRNHHTMPFPIMFVIPFVFEVFVVVFQYHFSNVGGMD